MGTERLAEQWLTLAESLRFDELERVKYFVEALERGSLNGGTGRMVARGDDGR